MTEENAVESRTSIEAQTLTQATTKVDDFTSIASSDNIEATKGRVQDAVACLVPNWDPSTQVVVEPLNGWQAKAFKASQVLSEGYQSEKVEFFVKLLPDEDELRRDAENDELLLNMMIDCAETSVKNTRLVGLAGLGPALIGADRNAMVQALVPGKWSPPLHEWSKLPKDQQRPSLETIGSFFAALHQIKIDTDAPMIPRYFLSWHNVPKEIHEAAQNGDIREEAKAPLLDVYNYLDSRADATGAGGEKVFYHGDAHVGNMLLQEDGKILALDLEVSGVGPRVADLAFFFWHWGWTFFGGNGDYPSLAVRQSIVHSYLGASGLSIGERDVQQMLLDIEYEVVRVAMCRFDSNSAFMLPFMHKLCEADQETSGMQGSLKGYIVEKGIMAVAFERAVSAGLVDGAGSLHFH